MLVKIKKYHSKNHKILRILRILIKIYLSEKKSTRPFIDDDSSSSALSKTFDMMAQNYLFIIRKTSALNIHDILSKRIKLNHHDILSKRIKFNNRDLLIKYAIIVCFEK